jgi:hypothetical protein
MPAGAWEYEQWVTWKSRKENDHEFNRFDVRHEFEYGVTDRFTAALYLDWRLQHSEDSSQFRDVAVEGVYQLTDPTKDFIGSAIYGEVKLGDEVFAVEGKLILQKNIGPFIIAWNGEIEAEWEGDDYEEDLGVFEQTLGVSYQVSPQFSFGVEALHEIEREDWREWSDHLVYVGPNVSYRAGAWWITAAPLFQASDVDSEAEFQTRFIFGINF